ncbi:Fructosamine kinase-domain-containing protein [Diplogelasinospora grovesii]|uniref:protein-ribulosamine 3-kinase n=1 Tax=Diplogelasinospora grovesii TaxID=303347 RepID=A0AAN6RZK2_9PEZI|nr:Fructosamine kinase-domain-containing protein [Diplogelasinospora grovesii]
MTSLERKRLLHLGLHVDANVLAAGSANTAQALGDVDRVLELDAQTKSAWAEGWRLKVRHLDGSEETYFMKVSLGYHGREALKGEFISTSAIYAITPDFCPKPIGFGTFQDDPDSHFYKLARLHSCSQQVSPGKFGFEIATYNGDLPQDNTWCDSWEECFTNGLRHVLKVREERAGPDPELDSLLPGLFGKVIPRLLRPLESSGRKVKPTLIHGDLWCGNAGIIDEDTEEGIIFDPASFWAHNEYELGNWRPQRNKFHSEYFDEYHRCMKVSEPCEDFDDRNALYALKFNLQAAALFPKLPQFLDMVKDEIRRLTELYPDG